jgi:sugar/nucleoside kinase (ribokinase family)
MGTELFCVGNAIVDIFAAYDYARLDQMGITEAVQHIGREQADLILRDLGVGGAPARGGPPPEGAALASGGGAANVAKIAALLGMDVSFAGCAGNDPLAAVFTSELAGAGVRVFLKQGTAQTGVCLALRDSGPEPAPGGQRRGSGQKGGPPFRVAVYPGAALEFTEADIDETCFAGLDAVALDGYALDRRSLVQRILRLADQSGIPVALDAASVFQVREKTEEILHYCRNYPLILFMNADEAIAFFYRITKSSGETVSGEREKETLILREVCPLLKIITQGELFPIIVIKLGSRGALVIAGGTVYQEETFAVLRPRDTMGAGDAFCAAFLAAWIRGGSLSSCAAAGNKVAREILEVPGTAIRADKLKSFTKQFRRFRR